MYKFSKKLNSLSFEETESRHALIGQVSDKISNITSLFSFAARHREYKSLDRQISGDFIPKQVRVYRYDFKVQIIAGILYLIMFSFILFYMIYLRIIGTITIGDFAFVFGLSIVVAENIWQATLSMQDLARVMGDFKSALSILLIPQQSIDKKDAKPLAVKKPKIEFRHVVFKYDKDHYIFQKLKSEYREPPEK